MKKITNAISLLLTVVVFVSAFGALPVSAETVTAYSSELTALEEALYNGYVNMDATIGISSHGASFNDVQTAFINVLIKRPEIFYVTNRLNVNLTSNVVTSVTPVYYCTKDEVATYRAQIDVAVDYIFSRHKFFAEGPGKRQPYRHKRCEAAMPKARGGRHLPDQSPASLPQRR